MNVDRARLGRRRRGREWEWRRVRVGKWGEEEGQVLYAAQERIVTQLTSFARLVEDESAERLVEVQQIIERQQDGHNLWRHLPKRIL